MVGYLRRLAEQTLQPIPRVHSAAALPCSQAQQWVAEGLEISTPFFGRSERSEESAVIPQPEQQIPRLPLGMTADSESTKTSTKSPPKTKADDPHQRQPEILRPPPTDLHVAPNDASDANQTRIFIAPQPAPRIQQPDAKSAAVLSERVTVSRSEAVQAGSTPVAIRPQRPPSPSESATPQRNDAPAPTPEVYIHIGRIELTAVSPPAAPRRESASTKKPMSLDEYLQRRRKAP
jgi:hypothetical protein